MNETIITAIGCFIIAVVGAWIVYRIFNKNEGPVVGPFRYVEAISKRKEYDMDVITYEIGLPVSPSTDVAKKIFTIRRADTGDGMFSSVESTDLPNEQVLIRLRAVQDTRVELELVAVDDSGNRSDPVYKSFTALDTIKPVLSGEMTIEAVGEDTAPPETPAETPPGDEAPAETDPTDDPAPSTEDSAATGDTAEAPTDTPPIGSEPQGRRPAETSDQADTTADPAAPPAHVPPSGPEHQDRRPAGD